VGTVCFSIQAAAEPGVMPRVLELFAKRNLVPERWVSGVHGPTERSMGDRKTELLIDLQVTVLSRVRLGPSPPPVHPMPFSAVGGREGARAGTATLE
jgi:hypothetical protein